MSTPQGIVPLLKAFKDNEIGKDAFLEGLNQTAHLLELQKQALARTQVIAKDREKWDTILLPGLEACFDVLIATAGEAAVYAQERQEQILYNVVYLLGQVDKATEMLKQQSGNLDQSTQALVSESLEQVNQQQDAVAMAQLQQGHAQTNISLFD